MATPQDLLVAEMVQLLDANQREEFEERAGIVEFDGQLPRAHAECLALLSVLHRHPAALLRVAQVEADGVAHWLLTPDRQHVAGIGGTGIRVARLADVLKEHFGGSAFLAKSIT